MAGLARAAGDGSSTEKNVPVKWSATENIAWKTAIPGEGHSSPVIYGDQVFLLSCLPEKQERVLISLDRNTGKPQWQRTVIKTPLETIHRLNSRASCTPVTDGKLIYVAVMKVDDKTIPAPNVGTARLITPGSIEVVAFDLKGNRKWSRNIGPFISAHGFSACPVLYRDLVIVNGDHDGEAYIAALDRATGELRWKTPRENKTRSYGTPLIRTIDGRDQMILCGSKSVTSHDPATGKRHIGSLTAPPNSSWPRWCTTANTSLSPAAIPSAISSPFGPTAAAMSPKPTLPGARGAARRTEQTSLRAL